MQKLEGGHLFLQERQDKILSMLHKEKKLLVSQLCGEFSVSPATIRSDLKEMESRGLLVRTHGGAILRTKSGAEKSSVQKQSVCQKEKKLIARAAASLVEEGDTIAIDTGTTAMAFAREIIRKNNLTIITNDLEIASFLEENSTATLVVIGGSLRRGFHCCIGAAAVEQLRRFRVDKGFLAVNGLTAEVGLSTPDMEHAEVKRQLIAISSRVILLCDSSKIGINSFCTIAPVSAVDVLVTDSGLSRRELESIQNQEIDVKICNVLEEKE